MKLLSLRRIRVKETQESLRIRRDNESLLNFSAPFPLCPLR